MVFLGGLSYIFMPLVWFNVYCYAVIFPICFVLHALASVGILAPAKPKKIDKDRAEYAATDIYQNWMDQKDSWFSLGDCANRYLVDTIGFYICIFARPLRFIRFNLRVLPLWYNPRTVVGFLECSYYMVTLPIMPIATVVFEGIFRPIKYKLGLEIDCKSSVPLFSSVSL